MGRSIQAKLLIGFLAALALLAVAGTLILSTMRRVEEDSQAVAEEFEVLRAFGEATRPLGEAAGAMQRFGADRRREEVEAAREAAGRAAEAVAGLRGRLDDGPETRGRRDRLDRMARELAALGDHLRNQGALLDAPAGADAIRRSMADGEAILAGIWQLRREVVAQQQAALQGRLDALRSADRVAWLGYLALVLVCLGLLATIYAVVRRDLAARARVEAELRTSRERYELAVRGSNDGLWDWDITTDVVYFSPRWKGMLGYEDGEIRNHFDEWSARLHPDDRQHALATVAAYHSGETSEYVLEHRLRHKDGTYRWVLARGMALRDGAGRPYRMAGSHTDITRRKEAERQLASQNLLLEEAAAAERDANETLRRAQARMVQSEKLAGLGQLVAGVAHEINNPLAFVTNNIAVLRRDVTALRELIELYRRADVQIAREDQALDRALRDLEDRADLPYVLESLPDLMARTLEGLGRIRRIVNDLRLFARLDEGEMDEADLNAGIASTATIIRGTARDRGIELALDLRPLPPIRCNVARVNQVILNLVSNAIDATDRGGTVRLSTAADPDGRGVRLQVADPGQGIDPAVRERIFDPFFTTKPVGQGTGLGLSISYGIVQEHGGTIEVESEPGRGATFTVWLPLRPPGRTPALPAAAVAAGALPAPDGPTPGLA
jgi:PAS domain S-box-containing protein